MAITRRRFLADVSRAVAVAGILPRHEVAIQPTHPTSGVAILDLGRTYGLRESRVGYRQALAHAGVPFIEVTPEYFAGARTVIVPAAVEISPAVAAALRGYLHAGARMLLESGAGFAEPAAFRSHQAILRDLFGVAVDKPVDVWARDVVAAHVPYVDYRWPQPAKVRDFSRVIPVAGDAAEIIGWTRGLPVAVRRSVGKGTLIFLGSPLGPVLWASDREACEWLGQVIS